MTALEGLSTALTDVAAELELPLSTAQTDTLLAYLALLQRWNATYNLTSVRDAPSMLVQHLADCLAVIRPLQRHLERHLERHSPGKPASQPRLMDVGSGGGLPGVVIAVMCPEVAVVCVDTVGKKAAFVRQVAGELKLRNLHAEHARVEGLKLPPFDVITSRAFASLADFVSLTRENLSPTGNWMAMKGKLPEAEIAALPANVEVFHVEHLAIPKLNADRCLIWIKPSLAAHAPVSP